MMRLKRNDEIEGRNKMPFFTRERIIILLIVVICGVVLGRLAVRFVLNLLLGGTMFGGDFL